ncbi:MAG TPA: hypothetical protein VG759_20255 [Candidatus Angelobacter sp.]|jgi:hypothetical protein|nr:hypothetical protein [Candidatus Angelobacter sp.]
MAIKDPFARKMVQSGLAFAGVLLFMIATFTLIYLHIRPGCAEEIISEATSPNGQWVVAVMQRRCGEESPVVTHINLRPAGRSTKYGFFSGKAEDSEIFSVEQEVQAVHFALVWDLPNRLIIRCRDCAHASLRQTRWNDLTIQYESRQ